MQNMRWSGGKSFDSGDAETYILIWAPQCSMVLLERAKCWLEMAPSLRPAARAGDLCLQSLSVIPHTQKKNQQTIKEFMAVFTGQGDSSDMIYHLCHSALPK